MPPSGETVKLRKFLKTRTSAAHDALDASVSQADLADPAGYADFLRKQLRARLPIEHWTSRNCPSAIRPPATAPLIEADLAAMGSPTDVDARETFSLPLDADPLGLAWAMAGSHMGNRAMLKQMRDAGSALPASFLADEAMMAFWRELRPQVEAEVPIDVAERAACGAEAVFDHFAIAFSASAAHRDAA